MTTAELHNIDDERLIREGEAAAVAYAKSLADARERILPMARGLIAARRKYGNVAFGDWFDHSPYAAIITNPNQRASLIKIGEHEAISIAFLRSTHLTSVVSIWEAIKPIIEAASSQGMKTESSSKMDFENSTAEPTDLEILDPKSSDLSSQGCEDDLTIDREVESGPDEPPEPSKTDLTVLENPLARGGSSPAPVPESLLARSPFTQRGYPKAELVLGYVLHRNTRSVLTKLLPPKRPGPLWDLLIYSIESGAYGPPSDAPIAEPSLRLLLPWMSGIAARRLRLDVTKAADQAIIRADVLPIVLANRDLDPDQLATLVVNHKAERENAARREQADRQASALKQRSDAKLVSAVSRMPASEQQVVAFGVTLWPRVNDDHAYTFTYQELCHAIWFSQFLLNNLPPDWDPVSKAIQSRHLIKYVTPMLSSKGWSVAVRQFMLAYENDPNGECRLPSPPINFGM